MVSTKSNIYQKYAPVWKKCRDVISGSRLVKEAGETYLPRPSGMEKEEYDKGYKTRAEFCDFTGRTFHGYKGLAFAKPMIKTVPEEFMGYLENVDGEGTNLDDFAYNVFQDCIKTNWGGILVDAPSSSGLSINEAEKLGLYPYMTYYPAEAIINVQFETVNRNKVLKMVVLQETKNVPLPDDKFTTQPQINYRVLELVDGVYAQSIYNKNEELVDTIVPLKQGKPMDYIPFFFTPQNEPTEPMLESLCDVNLAWYRKSADLENGAHWTGVPTPYSLGHTYNKDQDGVIKLGGTQFVYFPADVTHVDYLEFSGSGLSVLNKLLLDDQDRMALLGARIIATEKKGVESSETARIHKAGEDSVLATFCNRVSNTLTRALKDYLDWTVGYEITEEVSVHINTDYDLTDMDANRLTALISAWQTGGISKQTLFNNLKKGEIIDSDKSFEEEQSEIDETGIAIPTLDAE